MTLTDEQYDQFIERIEQRLRPMLTESFLATLVEAARTCGWNCDYIEIAKFVEYCFDLAGREHPAQLGAYIPGECEPDEQTNP